MKLSAPPRILDLDGSLTAQSELMKRATTPATSQELGRHLRYLCTRRALKRFAASLNPAQRHQLTFTGSGDFHHGSAVLLGQFRAPLSVVVFDQHPDWDITAPLACCGSWVNAALKLPQHPQNYRHRRGRRRFGRASSAARQHDGATQREIRNLSGDFGAFDNTFAAHAPFALRVGKATALSNGKPSNKWAGLT